MNWFNKIRITLILLFCINGIAIAADLNDIPVFANATRNKDIEERILAERANQPPLVENAGRPESSILERGIQIYQVDASMDAVFKFYKSKLNAVEAKESVAPSLLRKGKTSSIKYITSIYELTDTLNDDKNSRDYGNVIVSVKTKRYLLLKNRAPLRKDEWLKEAVFEWSKMDEEGRQAEYIVRVIDNGIPPNWKGLTDNTRIDVEFTIYRSEDEMEESAEKTEATAGILPADSKELPKPETKEPAKTMDIETILTKFSGRPITERETGLPLYPFSTFVPQATAYLGVSDYVTYVFYTTDTQEQVKIFFEGVTDNAFEQKGDELILSIKSENAISGEYISVQSAYESRGSAQTFIFIKRIIPAWLKN